MDLTVLLDNIKNHPDFNKVGMILCHNGIVRPTSRNGRKVSGLKIKVDYKKLRQVIKEHKKRPGIVEILVQFSDNRKLYIGDDIMFLVVAGDFRENVIKVLNDLINDIKAKVTKKTEYFI